MRKTVLRSIFVSADILLLFTGSIVVYVLSSTGMIVESDVPDVGIFSLVSLLLIGFLFIIEFVAIFQISDSTYHTALFTFFLLLYVVFCPDMVMYYNHIGLSPIIAVEEMAGEVFYVGTEISLLHFLGYIYSANCKKMPMYPLTIAAVGSIAVYASLISSPIRIIAHFFFTAVAVVYFVIQQVRAYFAEAANATTELSSVIFCAIAGMHNANALFFCDYLPYAAGLSVAHLWLCILCYLLVYLLFFIRTDKKASRAAEFQAQNEKLKMKVLVGQMKPHFIFNALTSIKSGYHEELFKGDNALGLFSDYLRESLSLLDTEIITFEQELQNISRYVDFINLSRERPFNVIYDIDASDFTVPAFSLQPFIENAIKYSKVNEKEGGYIMISSSEEDDTAVIRISDNGVGFDSSEIKEGAHGINNSKERFKLYFGTEPVVIGRISEGTEIIIRLKRATKAEEIKTEAVNEIGSG